MAIVEDDDADELVQAFVDLGLRVTKVATTGGFLRRGNATLLAAMADEAVEKAVDIVREQCGKREVVVDAAFHVRGTVGGGVVFVLDVEQFVKL
jgi:uncharacterized protein YaaQ